MLFWKQNKASRGGIIFAWENCNGTKRQGTKNVQHVWFCWQCTCYFPPKSLIFFLTQRQRWLLNCPLLFSSLHEWCWVILSFAHFSLFSTFAPLNLLQIPPVLEPRWELAGEARGSVHSSCSVCAPCQTICQLSPNLTMICLLNGNMLALIAMHCKIFQYSGLFFFFFLLHLNLGPGVSSSLLPSMTLILVTPHWVRVPAPGC